MNSSFVRVRNLISHHILFWRTLLQWVNAWRTFPVSCPGDLTERFYVLLSLKIIVLVYLDRIREQASRQAGLLLLHAPHYGIYGLHMQQSGDTVTECHFLSLNNFRRYFLGIGIARLLLWLNKHHVVKFRQRRLTVVGESALTKNT